MRIISHSIPALVLGLSSLALGSAAQADTFTLAFSTASHASAHVQRRLHQYPPPPAFPSRGHTYNRHHDHQKNAWIDRRGYHRRDDHGYQGKHQYRDRQHRQERQWHQGKHRSHSRTDYGRRGGRY
ncbi:MAG: hypothetical protein RQ736_10810 [Thiogranum sp.]|nr:hypothetical protein [Thiogranum sp.]